MEDPSPLDLATTQQLIDELLKRPTFFGVIVHVETDVKTQRPRKGDPVAVKASPRLSKLGAAAVLNRAAGQVLSQVLANAEQKRS